MKTNDPVIMQLHDIKYRDLESRDKPFTLAGSTIFNKNTLIVFIVCLLVRTLFTIFNNLNSYQFISDSREYVLLADKLLAGDFNFDIGRAVRSPLYPVFIAFHKFIFGAWWQNALMISQIILSSLTGIYLCLIGKVIFKTNNRLLPLITGLLYAVYVPAFYYVYSFSSETMYVFLFVASSYFLVKSFSTFALKDILRFSVFYSFAYLTRLEIIMYYPVVIVVLFVYYRKHLLNMMAFLTITLFVITLPWALINKHIHNQYITSGNAVPYVFYLSNSHLGYIDAVETPPLNSKEFLNLTNDYNYFNSGYDSTISLASNKKQAVFFNESVTWIKNNPGEFLKVKIYNFFHFLSPGLTPKHFPFSKWLISFLVSLPIHLLFYIGIYLALKKSLKDHLWFIGYYVMSLSALILFLYTARFRAISIEPYYLPYAGYAIYIIATKFWKRAESRDGIINISDGSPVVMNKNAITA